MFARAWLYQLVNSNFRMRDYEQIRLLIRISEIRIYHTDLDNMGDISGWWLPPQDLNQTPTLPLEAMSMKPYRVIKNRVHLLKYHPHRLALLKKRRVGRMARGPRG